MKKREKLKRLSIAIAVFVFTFLLAFCEALYSVDHIFSDPLYLSSTAPDNDIKIIAIDERTVAAYGDVADWSREIPAMLVETLNADKATAPAVIGFDIMFITEKDAEADKRFADACREGGNVISAVNVVYREKFSVQDGQMTVDKGNISMIEYPYAALRESADYGFANTYIDRDGLIRHAKDKVEFGGETLESFPIAVYRRYMEASGREVKLPRTRDGFYTFSYTGESGTYEAISLCDVLDGKIDPRVFAGGVVLVGAYAPGMQDAYGVAIDHGEQMYGVEIHANIIQALEEEQTAVPAINLIYSLVVAAFVLGFWLVAERAKIIPCTLAALGFIGADLLVSFILYRNGLEVRIIEPIIAILALYTVRLVVGYVVESIKKRRILGAFRKYVAPEVVEEIAKKGDYSVKLGGEKRHVAVLFVDIRGFTPMSEGLLPEQVVEILNEYLNLTTNAIFKNRGTLDKFIGDATMAVFNAPFDLDDYIFRAVSAALDIAAGSEELEKKLMERFGKSVSFGIGVNCGDAVVGNIGCEYRMDYTAIGDTVNTAARLESNAGRGQILISEAVYRELEGRIDVSEVGVIPLKGKSNEIFVYQLDGIKKTEA